MSFLALKSQLIFKFSSIRPMFRTNPRIRKEMVLFILFLRRPAFRCRPHSKVVLPLSFAFHRAEEKDLRFARYDYGLYYHFGVTRLSSRIGFSSYKVDYETKANNQIELDSVRTYFETHGAAV